VRSPFEGLDAVSLNRLLVPDFWQQQAVTALREGYDVVVDAPTGSGKTLIFELWSNAGKSRKQAIYTVPTRALANDKRSEWLDRGWNVGITTGDLSDNLSAPMIVATLETQKPKLMRGEGPDLLVIDEYQMIGDRHRGLNYEIAIASAPQHTQLLLMSGSVANPSDVVEWLQRLGRKAMLVQHQVRPVPLDEIDVRALSYRLPDEIKSYWPRAVAKALAEDLGPILIFAPYREAAETIARDIARMLPSPVPLELTDAQRDLAGEDLVKLIKTRVIYHHSGMSYTLRAGIIEPLAKAGQFRVVVATMGLASGINFSMRSVALAGQSYRHENKEQLLKPEEILQMFGRAGRRGIDERGYVIVTANELRLRDAAPGRLHRAGLIDWASLLTVMDGGLHDEPLVAAVHLQTRLFTTKPVLLGIEHSATKPDVPCGLHIDSARARHVARRVEEMLNSNGQWQPLPPLSLLSLKSITTSHLKPSDEKPLNPDGSGLEHPFANVSKLTFEKAMGDSLFAQVDATGLGITFQAGFFAGEDTLILNKPLVKILDCKRRRVTSEEWQATILPAIKEILENAGISVVDLNRKGRGLVISCSAWAVKIKAYVDEVGIPFIDPNTRTIFPPDCSICSEREVCQKLPVQQGIAAMWQKLGLIEGNGRLTLRGRAVSFFQRGDGLAIAAALEDLTYPIDELIYDIANLQGGYRFAGEEERWGGRLAFACRETYGNATSEGYLENGIPPKYGAGAAEIVHLIHKNLNMKYRFLSDRTGAGDIDRMIIEWRSLLRQIVHAPKIAWDRFNALRQLALTILGATQSPTFVNLPPLAAHQRSRVDHRLKLPRH